MDVLWKNMKVFTSKVKAYKGKSTYHLIGQYQNEFDKMSNCHSYIGEYYDNFEDWVNVVDEMKNNRDRYFITSGMKFKKKMEGLISADSKPVIRDSISKEDWNMTVVDDEQEKGFDNDLFSV